jgi:protein SCO1/2
VPSTQRAVRSRSSSASRICPDVCPTTLLDMSNDLAGLREEAAAVKTIFVTVDPERDTPEVLQEYLASFDPR